MTPEQILRLVEHHAAALAEHCDSVQIVVTMNDHGKTRKCHSGCGNYYARYGSVQEWLTEQDEKTREDVRPNEITIKEPPDDGDQWKQYVAEGV